MVEALDDIDFAVLGKLHNVCLPRSAVSRLGIGGIDRLYRYANVSPHEAVFVHRIEGHIVGSCTLSFAPQTLRRRLAARVQLWPWLAGAALRSLVARRRRWSKHSPSTKAAPSVGRSRLSPELIWIFSANNFRGRGVGSNLLMQAETYLENIGVSAYFAMTAAEGGNSAATFYERKGFVLCGSTLRQGEPFAVFRKSLQSLRERSVR